MCWTLTGLYLELSSLFLESPLLLQPLLEALLLNKPQYVSIEMWQGCTFPQGWPSVKCTVRASDEANVAAGGKFGASGFPTSGKLNLRRQVQWRGRRGSTRNSCYPFPLLKPIWGNSSPHQTAGSFSGGWIGMNWKLSKEAPQVQQVRTLHPHKPDPGTPMYHFIFIFYRTHSILKCTVMILYY